MLTTLGGKTSSRYLPIRKSTAQSRIEPNLRNYEAFRSTFTWASVQEELDGLPNNCGLNMAYEAVDRHVIHGRGDHLAIRWLGKNGDVRDVSYRTLMAETNQFANVLRGLGIGKGDRVFALLPRVPELYVACLGTLKNGSVFSPLFSAFGPEPIAARIQLGQGRVLITTEALYRKKVAAIREQLSTLEHVLILLPDRRSAQLNPSAAEQPPMDLPPGTHDLSALMAASDTHFSIGPTHPEDMALLHFTSGTTGTPKGAIHVHQAVVAHYVTGRLALDFHPEDIFWCTADPGWVTGISYGILSPLTNGISCVVDESDFDVERWYAILRDQKVTVWYTAPTAVRMMMRAGADIAKKYDTKSLRFIASVGEPLNPEAVLWGEKAFGLPIHDNWWQTETGGIMIANYASMEIRPGSMGKPLPGIEATIVRRIGSTVEICDKPDQEGELAIRRGFPSMFRGYLHDDARYDKCFVGDWYLTGDLARRDGDGYFWFVGRADDVIKSSGHLIGPFEVESALLEHPAVAEAGVIGKPDPVAMEIVKAFVSLKPGYEESESLARELLGFARMRLGAAVAPKEIAFVPSLPRTRSGKIMRRLLKARELGLPIGDTSTMEVQ